MTVERMLEFKSAFNHLQSEVYGVAKKNGFHEHDHEQLYVPVALALISSEVSEALEAHRNCAASVDLAYELADIVIRTMDLAAALGIDLGQLIITKHERNKTRPFRHGNKRY